MKCAPLPGARWAYLLCAAAHKIYCAAEVVMRSTAGIVRDSETILASDSASPRARYKERSHSISPALAFHEGMLGRAGLVSPTFSRAALVISKSALA